MLALRCGLVFPGKQFRAESERRSAAASAGRDERGGCNWVAISKDFSAQTSVRTQDQSDQHQRPISHLCEAGKRFQRRWLAVEQASCPCPSFAIKEQQPRGSIRISGHTPKGHQRFSTQDAKAALASRRDRQGRISGLSLAGKNVALERGYPLGDLASLRTLNLHHSLLLQDWQAIDCLVAWKFP
jgi:hypothetical protein